MQDRQQLERRVRELEAQLSQGRALARPGFRYTSQFTFGFHLSRERAPRGESERQHGASGLMYVAKREPAPPSAG